jgi:hypothetical protein
VSTQGFVQLLEDARHQALLDGRADFRQLANRLGQQAGSGDVGDQVTGGGSPRRNSTRNINAAMAV